MKNILIIGKDGYIGSALGMFLEKDFHVTAIGSKSDDYNLLSKTQLDTFDYVILLAGHSSVQMCDGPLRGIWNNNVRNFKNLVDKLSDNQRLIYASSGSVYGNNNTDQIYTENFINYSYINNYDLSKISLDILAENCINQGKNIIGLRFGTVNGGSPNLRIDLMINAMAHSAITNGYITIMNKHVQRPVLGLQDLCRAMKQIIVSNFTPGIYNLASMNLNVDQISQTVKDILKVDIIDNGYSSTYDFAINTDKFCNSYNFKFVETVSSITESVVKSIHSNKTALVKRNIYFDYQG
jgi:nucleoside-diphosphate-sugar epimerase